MQVQWHTAGLLATVAVFAGTATLVFHHVYRLQPTPFIDEAFHVPQCQRYCAGNFTQWDDKITTLPGLYLLSVGVLGYTSGLQRPACSLYLLRLVNLLFSVGTLVTLYSILKVLNAEQERREWRHLVAALSLASFPVLYTFSFLYYTDMASTLLVLLMYSLHLHRQPGAAAAIGAVSVLVRQSNVVWVAVVGAFACTDAMVAALAAARSAPRRRPVDPSSPRIVREVLHFYWSQARHDPLALAEALTDVVYEGVQYGAVCAAFVAFVAWNGALVVGDRSAHEAVLNAPQLLYFLATSAVWLAPLMVESAQQMLATVRARPALWAALAAGLALLLQSAGAPHPYLLADNRHVAFYAWRRWLGHRTLRLTLVPVSAATLALLAAGGARRPLLQRAALAAGTALVLVPQRLLEFRYFIVPFLLWRLQLRPPGGAALLAECALYAAVNAAVLYLFTVKTFTWDDQPGVQRIIW
ncbi:putative Dol-P-Glc:Glc(2)Man(9)GlcNAc(2)-PP-Dol alpha-1,2-glucosyltransferase [Amphibalanus amphitrite]|uniref:Dol-P-Glc:Glc(2)Man(9)GlcNAc(2)-PP-Dol alpha-1,2-glucosyltransferase n=1 Tax=Amphibalanus amphitrite TaxID=1232801 RepID=A0A6A4WTS2_AMPAM|nr:putative Dol-P-Glc:Glc(2)Man(9)GlcNAc(2)-PP-Dol alpha-1,2-glucosyltransferase [Amphibalanus amphitrite]